MAIDGAPVLEILRASMGWLTQRQQALAENVANANTPGYTPSDISTASFEKALRNQLRDKPSMMRTTSDKHMSFASAGPEGLAPDGLVARAAPDTVVTVNGNSVVLEDQMTKVAETRMRYEAIVGLYQKSLNMVRSAARAPGRG